MEDSGLIIGDSKLHIDENDNIVIENKNIKEHKDCLNAFFKLNLLNILKGIYNFF